MRCSKQIYYFFFGIFYNLFHISEGENCINTIIKAYIMGGSVLIRSIPLDQLQDVIGLVGYENGQVVQRTLARNDAFSTTLFAYDKGQKIENRGDSKDAMIQILEGEATLVIGEKEHIAAAGAVEIISAGTSYCLEAKEQFKMLLTMVMDPDLIQLEKE